MTDVNQLTVKQEPDPYEFEYPVSIREIVEKMTRQEEITYPEATLACQVLGHIFYDISETLTKAHRQLRYSLNPVIQASEYLHRIYEEENSGKAG